MSTPSLQGAEWLQRAQTQAIFAALEGAQGRTRAVGGVVRDTLLGRHRGNPDIDLATELLPEVVMSRAKAAGIACYPTGIDHGTITLKLDGTLAEVTTLRRDIQTDGRHAVVAFGTDWTVDASRRDFTLNALYCGPDGTLFDPLGGLDDTLAGKVRFIGEAAQRITEDGLRVYRFFRFSASHGGQQFDPDGLLACAAAKDQLGHLSRERVGSEIMRMLALPQVAMTLLMMAELGLVVFDDAAARALVAYEALGGRLAAARLSLLASGDLETVQKAWRLSNAVVASARAIGQAADLLAEDKLGEAAYRQGESAVEGLAVIASREAWGQARLAETARVLAGIVVPPFPVSGTDLAGLGIKPGPGMGQALARLERAWIDSGFALGKAALLGLTTR